MFNRGSKRVGEPLLAPPWEGTCYFEEVSKWLSRTSVIANYLLREVPPPLPPFVQEREQLLVPLPPSINVFTKVEAFAIFKNHDEIYQESSYSAMLDATN
jgi:hypothetical protein